MSDLYHIHVIKKQYTLTEWLGNLFWEMDDLETLFSESMQPVVPKGWKYVSSIANWTFKTESSEAMESGDPFKNRAERRGHAR